MLVVTGAGPSSPGWGRSQMQMGKRKSGSQKPHYHRGKDKPPEPVPESGLRDWCASFLLRSHHQGEGLAGQRSSPNVGELALPMPSKCCGLQNSYYKQSPTLSEVRRGACRSDSNHLAASLCLWGWGWGLHGLPSAGVAVSGVIAWEVSSVSFPPPPPAPQEWSLECCMSGSPPDSSTTRI